AQRLAALVPRLYNFTINNKPLSSAIKRAIGFAADRSLPEVGQTTLRQWIRREMRRVSQRSSNDGLETPKQVYLFCDEFTNYNDVEIGQAAYRLLTTL